MSLIALKHYLVKTKFANLAGISHYFNSDPDVVRDMLSHWIRKGCVRQLPKNEMCGGRCIQCSPLMTEVYEWIT